MTERSATLDAAAEIARRAGVSIELVWAFFSFDGRLTSSDQMRISTAADQVLGLGRDRATQRRIARLHKFADHFFAFEHRQGSP